MRGSLTPTFGLADVVRGIYVGRRSGILALHRREAQKRLYFEKGSFVFSDTNDTSWRFGQLLVQRGKLLQADLDHVLTLLGPGKRIGMVLRDLGYLDEAGLAEAVSYQITENVYPCFAWEEGDYDFTEMETPAPSDIAFALSTANVIMEGVRRIPDPEFVARALGGREQIVSLGSNPLLRFQAIFLKPMEGFILSRIDGNLSIEEVSTICPVPEEEVLRCLYGLKGTGILEFRLERDLPEDVAGEDGNVASFFSDYAGVEQFLGGTAASRTAGLRMTPEEEREQHEILELAERLDTLDHYSVLGVAQGADAKTVRKAYYRLAKKYHPDRHHKTHLTNLQDRLERIFIRVNEAYETLKDDDQRIAYDRRRQAGGPISRDDASARAAAEADPAEEAERRKKNAEMSFREGRHLWEAGDIFSAIRAFQTAVRSAPQVASYQSHLGRALGRNPKWRKEAEEHLLKAIELEPGNAEHYVELATVYEAAGLGTRAHRYFEEALRWDPLNQRASEGSARHQGEARKTDGKTGALRNLFGDKHK